MASNSEFGFDLLRKKIEDKTGLDCRNYKDNYLRRRIDLRMKAVGMGSSYNEYGRFLDKNPEEYKSILDTITINVTEFFRDPETFEAFRNEVMPQLLSTKMKYKSKIIRIWSAGCSIGEEPYTISIILHEKLGLALKDYLVSIHATDIDGKALSVAGVGVYDAQALKKMHKPLITKYFDLEGDGRYRIKDNARRLVKFQQHDLFSDWKFSNFDVIFCRNVMIHFDKEFQSRLLLDFYNALNDGGYLILGRTETMPPGDIREKFENVNTKERIYQKKKKSNG